jgi:long-chain fatty acid transport protein
MRFAARALQGSPVLLALGLMACTAALEAQSPNLYTIPNQSAHFVRMPSRESSTEIDAVFHNPAGLVELDEGLHLSLNNQFLRQASTIVSNYQYLNPNPAEYSGVASSLVFPSLYAAYRKGPMAWSAGLMMIGGAGGAEYSNLPEVDAGIADVIPLMRQLAPLNQIDAFLQAQTGENPGYANLTDYRFRFESAGYGFSPGLQLGASYQANRLFAVAFGLRFVQQFVVATSDLRDVEVYNEAQGGWSSPGDYLRMVASDPGLSTSPVFPPVLGAVAQQLDTDLAPVELDLAQYGIGLTPIVGLAIRPNDKVNVGIRYEHNTAMTLKTRIRSGKDAGGRFRDGERTRADLPGFATLGIGYKMFRRMQTRIGFRYMLDTQTDWNGRDSLITGNYYEVSIASQYSLGERYLISGGYTFNKPRVDSDFQYETDFRLPGHTAALGGACDLNDRMRVNLGVMYTYFSPETAMYSHPFGGNENVSLANELTFRKNALVMALGLDMRLNGNGNGKTAKASSRL